ncbi:MAG: hypothetical protein AAB542_00855 [Patescibacteria group bacterium]
MRGWRTFIFIISDHKSNPAFARWIAFLKERELTAHGCEGCSARIKPQRWMQTCNGVSVMGEKGTHRIMVAADLPESRTSECLVYDRVLISKEH